MRSRSRNIMPDKKSRAFFIIFFILIAGSIALTYYQIMVAGNYHSFSSESDIPEPLEYYKDVLRKLRIQ